MIRHSPAISRVSLALPPLLALLALLAGCGTGRDDGASSASSLETVGSCGQVGHYVSGATCAAAHQCGTVALPFCTIGQGVRATADGEVDVAAGNYPESVELRDGVSVLGGFDPTFASPRNPDPTSTNANRTTLSMVSGPALAWPLTVTASIDGVQVLIRKAPDDVATPPSTRSAIVVAGSAHATLRNLTIAVDDDVRAVGEERALWVSDGSGGSVDLHAVTLVTPPYANSSYGILVNDNANVSFTAETTNVLPGSSSSESVGVDERGDGSMTFHGGEIHAGTASRAFGVRSNRKVSSRAIDLDGVSVEAARASTAVAVLVGGAGSLRVHGGHVNGKGPDGLDTGASPIGGVIVDSVKDLVIDGGVTIQGDDGAWKYRGQAAEPESVFGVQITNAKAVSGAHATITDATVLGGTYGTLRVATERCASPSPPTACL